jgi:hypothetical protein
MVIRLLIVVLIFNLHIFKLKLHLINVIHINRPEIPVNIDDNSYSYGSFSSCNRNDNQGEEMPLQILWVQVFVESNEIDIY